MESTRFLGNANSDNLNEGVNDFEHGALVVVGSGPGIGLHAAALFARKGFVRIVLMSRNKDRLGDQAVQVRSIAPMATIDVVSTDLADTSLLAYSLAEVDKMLGDIPIECVLFNAAGVGPCSTLDWTPEELQRDLMFSVVSFTIVANWAFGQLSVLAGTQRCSPTLVVTTESAQPNSTSRRYDMEASRAAQKSLAENYYSEYGPKGIHCGMVLVGGAISEDAPVCNPSNIADAIWQLYDQNKDGWTFDMPPLIEASPMGPPFDRSEPQQLPGEELMDKFTNKKRKNQEST